MKQEGQHLQILHKLIDMQHYVYWENQLKILYITVSIDYMKHLTLLRLRCLNNYENFVGPMT